METDILYKTGLPSGVPMQCRMLYKTKHWSLPDYQPWGIPLVYLYFYRFSELLVHKPGEGFILKEISSCLITTTERGSMIELKREVSF